jgi:L-threonylcarbamoyladenylate synthase
MKTVVWHVDDVSPDLELIRKAARIIRSGGLVAFPTETVYGLGVDALNAEAVSALFEAKKRPLDNPPIVHVSDRRMVRRLARTVSGEARKLMEEFWPGPLTLIFERSEVVPDVTVAGLDTVAVRMPKHRVALALIEESDCPIAAPSANLAGRPSPTLAKHVLEDLNGRIDGLLDAGPTRIGVESTVLDLTVYPPQILRPGGTPYDVLKKSIGNVELNPVVASVRALPVETARSPGIKHKHYAPRADMVLVEGEVQAVVGKVKELAERFLQEGMKVGILCTDETALGYAGVSVVKSLGSRENVAVIARNLFAKLREFDETAVDVILAEGLPMEGLGLAVMNRLRKASGYNIVEASMLEGENG